MSRILPALAVAALLTGGCGYIGEPLPPLANVPSRVTDLAAVQRGSRIIVQFTIPQLTTEGVAIEEPLKFDLRIGLGAVPFNENDWAAHAKEVPGAEIKAGTAHYELPTAEWSGKDAILAVRAIGANKKQSGWSHFAVVPVVPPPDQPADVTPTSSAEGVHLTWRARGNTFRVFRKTEGETAFTLVATVQQPQWTDPNTEFGKPYTYQVLTVVKLTDEREAQSDLSAEVTFKPVDTFPPAAPAGLHPSAAPNSIELTWDRNNEPDLAGYRIYRSLGTGAFDKIADVSQIPSYSDRSVEHGKTYRYAITAVDQAGNEGPKSPAAEVLLP